MFETIQHLFIVLFYQPIYNILILAYDGLDIFMNPADMGIAVIILTVIVRLILYPLSRNQEASAEEQHDVAEKMDVIQQEHQYDPITARKMRRSLMWRNKRLIFSSLLNIFIQVIIAIVFYLIFSVGLTIRDPKMLYSFVPSPQLEPFNLIFLGIFDLTEPSVALNVLNTILIFVVESLAIYVSLYPVQREDRIVQYVLPAAAFIFFSQMPAGKKLFVIATLSISTILLMIKAYRRLLDNISHGRREKQIEAHQHV